MSTEFGYFRAFHTQESILMGLPLERGQDHSIQTFATKPTLNIHPMYDGVILGNGGGGRGTGHPETPTEPIFRGIFWFEVSSSDSGTSLEVRPYPFRTVPQDTEGGPPTWKICVRPFQKCLVIETLCKVTWFVWLRRRCLVRQDPSSGETRNQWKRHLTSVSITRW